MATNVRTARDNLGIFDTIVLGTTGELRLTQNLATVDGATGELRLTQGLATVDGATGELRLTQALATVDGAFGTRRITQEVAYVDMAAGGRRISQTLASVDGAFGTRRVSQVQLSYDIASWYLRPADTLPLYDTVVATKIVAPHEQTIYTCVATDGLPITDWTMSQITYGQRWDFWGEGDYYREVAALMRVESFALYRP